jgi:hypothetical protein
MRVTDFASKKGRRAVIGLGYKNGVAWSFRVKKHAL